jgi:GDP-L-fucose synthase
VFNSDKPDGQYRKPSDGTKLNSYLPEFQWTPLEEGIEKTILWFENNFNNLRK